MCSVEDSTRTENQSLSASSEDRQIDFDLENYISRYSLDSETRLQRLLFIAQIASKKGNDANNALDNHDCVMEEKQMDISSDSNDSLNGEKNHLEHTLRYGKLAQTAYQLAMTHMKSHGNVTKYKELFGKSGNADDDEDDDYNNDIKLSDRKSNANGNNQDGDMDMESTPDPTPAVVEKKASKAATNTSSSVGTILQTLGIEYDEEWIYQTEHNQQIQLETLESRLSSAQAHLNKDAIRTAFFSLSNYYRKSGQLKQAMKYLVHARDYCSSSIASLCLDICILGIDMGDWRMVDVYSKKAESVVSTSVNNTSTGNDDALNMRSSSVEMTGGVGTSSSYGTSFSHNTITLAKIQCINALAHLHAGQYDQAALKFASISPELGSNNTTSMNDTSTNMGHTKASNVCHFHNVIVPEDIALYGSVLALASLDRKTLRSSILESSLFQQRLELIPKMRDALRFIDRADYSQGLKLLFSMEKEMRLDIHLSSHVDTLFAKVKERCMVLYFYPYSCISLKEIKESFCMDSVDEVEEVVEKLILEGKIIGARMNAKDGTLKRDSSNDEKRDKLLWKVKQMGDRFVGDVESMMLRLSCLEQDLVVQSDNAPRWKNRSKSKGNTGSSSGNAMGNGNEPILDEGSSEEDEVVMMDM